MPARRSDIACASTARASRRAFVMLGPARRAGLTLGRLIEQVDGGLRQWPAASLSLLVVAILLGSALMAAR